MSSLPDPSPRPPSSTLIRIEGRDALALIHRISTQSLLDLEPGRCRMTLFCDFRGRLLHRAAVAMTADAAVWLARPDAAGEELVAYLDHHIFREDARVSDHSGEFRVGSVAGDDDRATGVASEKDGVPVRFDVEPGFAFVMSRATDSETTPVESEVSRILAGRPRHGHELREDFNPFEVGLARDVHLNKGCFAGQEALMRMITYRGVRRRLALVRGAGEPPPVPRPVTADPLPAGILTSAASESNGWVGLTVLRHDAIDTASPLEIEAWGAIEPARSFPEAQPLGLP